MAALGMATVIIFFLLTFPQAASALPSLARKYNRNCMTWHIAPPVLNAFGEAFLNNGYRTPDGDEELVEQGQTLPSRGTMAAVRSRGSLLEPKSWFFWDESLERAEKTVQLGSGQTRVEDVELRSR